MKTLTFLLLIAQGAWAESTYDCRSASGLEVTLTVVNELNQITWWNHTLSEFNIAPYKGIDELHSSKEKGYLTFFAAADEESSETSGTLYKITPDYQTKSPFRVVEIFNSEELEEERTEFQCGGYNVTVSFDR